MLRIKLKFAYSTKWVQWFQNHPGQTLECSLELSSYSACCGWKIRRCQLGALENCCIAEGYRKSNNSSLGRQSFSRSSLGYRFYLGVPYLRESFSSKINQEVIEYRKKNYISFESFPQNLQSTKWRHKTLRHPAVSIGNFTLYRQFHNATNF